MERNYRYGVPYAYASEVIEKNVAVDRDEMKETGSDTYTGLNSLSIADFQVRYSGSFESTAEHEIGVSLRHPIEKFKSLKPYSTGGLSSAHESVRRYTEKEGLTEYVRRPEVPSVTRDEHDELLVVGRTSDVGSKYIVPSDVSWTTSNIHLRPINCQVLEPSRQEIRFELFKELADLKGGLGHRIIDWVLMAEAHISFADLCGQFNPTSDPETEEVILEVLQSAYVRDNLIRETEDLKDGSLWFGPLQVAIPSRSSLSAFVSPGIETWQRRSAVRERAERRRRHKEEDAEYKKRKKENPRLAVELQMDLQAQLQWLNAQSSYRTSMFKALHATGLSIKQIGADLIYAKANEQYLRAVSDYNKLARKYVYR